MVPFVYTPPKISLNLLDDARKFAPAAIPQLLQINDFISNASPSMFYNVRQKIEDILGEETIDCRLLTQYALSIAVSNQV